RRAAGVVVEVLLGLLDLLGARADAREEVVRGRRGRGGLADAAERRRGLAARPRRLGRGARRDRGPRERRTRGLRRGRGGRGGGGRGGDGRGRGGRPGGPPGGGGGGGRGRGGRRGRRGEGGEPLRLGGGGGRGVGRAHATDGDGLAEPSHGGRRRRGPHRPGRPGHRGPRRRGGRTRARAGRHDGRRGRRADRDPLGGLLHGREPPRLVQAPHAARGGRGAHDGRLRRVVGGPGRLAQRTARRGRGRRGGGPRCGRRLPPAGRGCRGGRRRAGLRRALGRGGGLALPDLAPRERAYGLHVAAVVTHRAVLDTNRAWRCTGPRRPEPGTTPAGPPPHVDGRPSTRWRGPGPRAW